jgi:hypothetical protein
MTIYYKKIRKYTTLAEVREIERKREKKLQYGRRK